MKRLYFFVVATLVLGCFGCANLPIEEDVVVVEPADYTLEVSIAEPHTKVSLGNKGENVMLVVSGILLLRKKINLLNFLIYL